MVAFNKKDAQSYAPNSSYTNSITYTEKNQQTSNYRVVRLYSSGICHAKDNLTNLPTIHYLSAKA